jgi:type I restriction enzyme M protein
LFTGDAGQAESNIRRWILENDWLEVIIALPLNMFYNTGIATYIWVLTNRKPEHRRGKVQLIDATAWFKPLRKNLGKKNCELSEEDIEHICQVFLGVEESEQSKVFPNEAFGYWKVTVERPLRLRVDLSEATRARFHHRCAHEKEQDLADGVNRVAQALGAGPHLDWNAFLSSLSLQGVTLSSKRQRMLQTELASRDDTATPVIAKVDKTGKAEPDPLHGRFAAEMDGRAAVVEYEPDPELRDTEQVPLLEDGGIEAFIRREVLPYAADAWYDREAVKLEYEISFTRYFYKPQPLRTLDEIRADILALQHETEGLLDAIIGGDAEVC